jgi:putative nucleotidyltransferase with HDIG domain
MDPEASYGAATSELVWAEQTARRLLEPLGARWRHTVGVADRARAVGKALAQGEAELLIAAAYLHDIGYAPEVAQTSFHAVDGARFVRSAGHERLAQLVAYHSGARAEAAERDLADELSEFKDERSMVSRALTYCDLTTDAEGRPVEAPDRLADIRERYGSESPEARALGRSGSALLDDVRIVEAMLQQKGVRESADSAGDLGCRG